MLSSTRVPDGYQTNNDLENREVIYYYKIGEEKRHISKICTKAAYLRMVENQTVDLRYKSKWEEYLNLTDYNWEEVWNTIHHSLCHIKITDYNWEKVWNTIHHSLCHNAIKSDIFKQVHLKFFSPYIQGKTDSNAGYCNLCKKVQESQKHHVAECEATKEIFSHFGNLIYALKPITMTKQEMVFGMKEEKQRLMSEIRLLFYKEQDL